jgi:hypothetical protein
MELVFQTPQEVYLVVVFLGGTPIDIMDYITIATTGNATDFGDLTAATHFSWQFLMLQEVYLVVGAFGPDTNVIDYITLLRQVMLLTLAT